MLISHIAILQSLVQETAMACLFLAGKAEEQPRKLKEIIPRMAEIDHVERMEALPQDKRKPFVPLTMQVSLSARHAQHCHTTPSNPSLD